MNFLRRFKKKLFPTEQKKEYRRWCKDGGDERFRYSYDLNSDSIVMDVGGFEGEWVERIFNRYGCEVHVFEPVRAFFERIEGMFRNNEKVVVHEMGLGGTERREKISIEKNASSLYKDGDESEEISIADVSKWLHDYSISEVDLIKINIEGGEFELLEKLIDIGKLDIFKNIQVQFHSFAPDAGARMERIRKHLEKTHHFTYRYRYIWENWERSS